MFGNLGPFFKYVRAHFGETSGEIGSFHMTVLKRLVFRGEIRFGELSNSFALHQHSAETLMCATCHSQAAQAAVCLTTVATAHGVCLTDANQPRKLLTV